MTKIRISIAWLLMGFAAILWYGVMGIAMVIFYPLTKLAPTTSPAPRYQPVPTFTVRTNSYVN